MAKYTPRITAPSKTDIHYYSKDNPYYATGYGMPNCAAYAWGRLYEITNTKPNKLLGQPEDWFATAQKISMKVGQEPKLGAIAVWKKGKVQNSTDGTGHVATVEAIYPNGDFDSGNSQWKGKEFFIKKITKASKYQYAAGFDFLGFIYCGIEWDEEEQASSTSSTSAASEIKAGTKFVIKNMDIYTSDTGAVFSQRTGTYYAWEDKKVAKGNRIRMTNHPTRVGVKGQVSFLVETTDLVKGETPAQPQTITSPIVKAGTKVNLKDAPVYTSENGTSVGKRTGVYYTWEDTDTSKIKRVRVTNSPNRVGVPRQVSFFIDNSLVK